MLLYNIIVYISYSALLIYSDLFNTLYFAIIFTTYEYIFEICKIK